MFNFDDDSQRRPLSSLSLREIDQIRIDSAAASAATTTEATMSVTQEQFQQLQQMMETQQKQIQEMREASQVQHSNLLESQRQLQISQDTVQSLTQSFQSLSTQPRAAAASARKKPDLPPFDPKNIIVWIRRLNAAYDRAAIILAKDKFAFLESTFPVKQNATIDAFMYGTNTDDDWEDFMTYLKDEYGPTIRQKAVKLMSDNPRHDVKPSVFLAQLVDDTRDVTVDHILREHVLKSIPPRIREIMGKEVEQMTAQEVAKMADDFFDRNGRPIEKSTHPINNIVNNSNSSSSASASNFTAAFQDDDDSDVNFVKRGSAQGNRQRSKSRNFRSNSRPPFNSSSSSSNSSSSAATASSSSSSSSQQNKQGMCRWHRQFGQKSRKCVTDCSLYQSFLSQQRQGSGNGQGGRRQ